jgi:glycosyltransferase involved in cell wall biosynthesis
MNRPTVSVLIPAYNAEVYIEEAVESILSQTYQDFEIIIVDDASTDKTWQVIQALAKTDKRIKTYRNPSNLYIAGNRNRLIKLSNGKYIAWQDADDISMPYRLEEEVKFLEKHTDVALVGGFIEFFTDQKILSTRKYKRDDKSIRKTIFRFSPVAQPSSMVRRKVFDEIGYYDVKYPPAEDLDVAFRIGTKYKFGNIQKVLIRYRESPNSATFKKLKKIELDTLELRFKYRNHPAYKFTFIDYLYNLLQYIFIYTIPPKIKIKIFNLFRNTLNEKT